MSSPRRLLTLGHSYVLRVNRRLAHAMSVVGGERWDVTVAAPRHFRGHRDLRPAMLDHTNDEPTPFVPLNAYLTRRVQLFCYGRELHLLLKNGTWDLVHAWEEPYILAGAQIAAYIPRPTPYVFRTAQSLNKRYPPPFNWLERRTVARASGWICSGRTVAENLKARAGYNQIPMTQIPLGVDLDSFYPDPAAATTTRRKLGWNDDKIPVIGYLGRFVPEKGLPMLMRALDRLRSPWRALFVGGGLLERSLLAWASRHPENVRVLTGVPHLDIPPYLNAMDLLVAPSQTTSFWREQFGRMLIEAFATGKPVVGSDSGEIPNVLEDSGIVLPEASEDAWVATLDRLLQSPEERHELGQRGLARAGSFAWSEVARKHLDFFESILDSRSEMSRIDR